MKRKFWGSNYYIELQEGFVGLVQSLIWVKHRPGTKVLEQHFMIKEVTTEFIDSGE